MEGAVMVGRGPTGAGVLVLSILVITLTTEGCRAQKGDGCGPTVLGPSSGTLSSLGYPATYPNNTVCEWEISVPPGKRVHFCFAQLDIEDRDCQVNYLRLYNGIGPNRKEIAKYCGLNLKVDELIESTGNQVTVQFMSGTHHTGRGFYLSYATTEHTDLITCLHKGSDFHQAEFSKYCPAGCLTSTEEISGTIPNGYRESSPLCVAAVHAGVVSNAVGGRINVVSSKGIPLYEGTLANNVTSTGGLLSNSLFTFRTNGCYGTLGLESGGVADIQISASSVWEWNNMAGQRSVWAASGARLKKAGLPWGPSRCDQQQWLQVDLKRQKRITGITTTGSTLREYQYYVSAYRVLYSQDGQQWLCYKEANATQDTVFQGNINYLHEVRNNFIPPMEARYVRINPTLWHQRIAIKVELLGCQVNTAPLPHGVSQGSILAPILFALFFLPLGSIFSKYGIAFHFYADDCQIYFPMAQNNTVQRLIDCLHDIKVWLSANFLSLNKDKTEVMMFGPSRSPSPNVDLGTLTPYLSDCVTNFGVKFGSDFKFQKQISSVVQKSFYQSRQIAKVKPLLSGHDLEKLIHAFISNGLDYCNALYVGISQASLARLQLVQNSAARLLTQTRRREHITPILASLHWLPVRYPINFKLLLFAFKCLNNLAPTYLSDLLQPYCPTRSLRSADQLLLTVPDTRLKLRGDRTFAAAAPKLWNDRPLSVRQASSLPVFKSLLKIYFYSLAFNTE
ncbi:discoidin, CUB and LCCL domain-containing protein 2 isoform X1 [Nerophis ophidion]|uniref:discoidin, CUB and LCCL domain-containing protein 2 isoform X1 n=1 Tax=Nerophis ophidion TaxID=159077 RepID=UPI002AE0AEC4|nr:discoidin, CUB and LCCL domain-containing protein 2 isoform X1 [Nerophis ophidion]